MHIPKYFLDIFVRFLYFDQMCIEKNYEPYKELGGKHNTYSNLV